MRFAPLAALVLVALAGAETPAHANPIRLDRYRNPRAPIGPFVRPARVLPTPLPAHLAPRHPNLAPTFDAWNRRTTRGIDPHGAAVLVPMPGLSAGRYATQATQARQATQATQARQYQQYRILRPVPSLPRAPRP